MEIWAVAANLLGDAQSKAPRLSKSISEKNQTLVSGLLNLNFLLTLIASQSEAEKDSVVS